MQMPPIGTRVMVRHRLPAGSVPPLTDVIGHLVQTDPTLQVRTKRGDVVAVAVDDVVVIKALGAAPVRSLRHPQPRVRRGAGLAGCRAAVARVDGCCGRPGESPTAAIRLCPLEVEADLSAVPAIVDWYAARGLTPWLSVPDRLIRLPDVAAHLETVVMSREVPYRRIFCRSDVGLGARCGVDAALRT